MPTDPFEALQALVRQRQAERGFTEFFEVGDLVRFPLGVPYNRERDYRIKTIYNNGFEVECDGFVYAHADTDAQRLGMTHSPDQPASRPTEETMSTERVTVEVLLLFGDQAEIVAADVPPGERAAPERCPAAEIADAVGVPAGDLPGVRLTAEVGEDGRLSGWQRA